MNTLLYICLGVILPVMGYYIFRFYRDLKIADFPVMKGIQNSFHLRTRRANECIADLRREIELLKIQNTETNRFIYELNESVKNERPVPLKWIKEFSSMQEKVNELAVKAKFERIENFLESIHLINLELSALKKDCRDVGKFSLENIKILNDKIEKIKPTKKKSTKKKAENGA